MSGTRGQIVSESGEHSAMKSSLGRSRTRVEASTWRTYGAVTVQKDGSTLVSLRRTGGDGDVVANACTVLVAKLGPEGDDGQYRLREVRMPDASADEVAGIIAEMRPEERDRLAAMVKGWSREVPRG